MTAPATAGLLHLVVGPAEHGVVRFGRDLARLAGGARLDLGRVESGSPPRLSGPDGIAPSAVHLQYTDSLYGTDTTSAAATFTDLCDHVRATTGASVTVTLHDLPDPVDEPGRYRRRAAGYARIASAVDGVMVSSDHEHALLAALPGLRDAAPVTVIPLPIETLPELVATGPEPRSEVAVFGFVYPGKGHRDVLDAMADLPSSVGFTALGRAADGHAELAADLTARAERSGRRFELAGFVPDRTLAGRLQQVAVPVAPARTVSASGSVNTWIAAGRRPLVATGGYATELAGRYPGSIHLYRPGDLPGMLRAVLTDPGLSWLDSPVPVALGGAAVGSAYARAIRPSPA